METGRPPLGRGGVAIRSLRPRPLPASTWPRRKAARATAPRVARRARKNTTRRPPSPQGKSSPTKAAEAAPPPPPQPPGNAEEMKLTQTLQDLMTQKMNVWQKILGSHKDEERKEGLQIYKNMAEEELRIIARNISKTKLQELVDQQLNYFVQIGTSTAEEQKLAGMQGFKQVSDEECALAAMEAPELAHQVFGDIRMGDPPPLNLQGPPSAFAPTAVHMTPGARLPGAYQPGAAPVFMPPGSTSFRRLPAWCRAWWYTWGVPWRHCVGATWS
ncbi:hypothetical protein MRX96_004300 [Rhipicephalus microplus]